ncbi:MAG: excinuclease ABC subunit UvrB [Patescibacteria group bacterium]
MEFKLHSTFKPTGDQPEAIEKLVTGIRAGEKHQVLLGVTGSGKTFTMANVIAKLQRPTLVISHNKTLAAQLYQEFRDFFPENAVCFFVSYYDYYQPEAYIPQTDTYIEKETEINELIDKLRLESTTNILTRPDTIIVASVSCIYNLGSPREYGHFVLEVEIGQKIDRQEILRRLTRLQYDRADYGFHRGTFRVRGDTIDIFPAYEDVAVRIEMEGERITKIAKIDPLNGKILPTSRAAGTALRQSVATQRRVASGDARHFALPTSVLIYPAKHYMTDPASLSDVFVEIRKDLEERLRELRSQGKILEAHRLEQRVNYDLEMIEETGYVNGVENYSRYFDGRKPGEPPYTLLDYFKEPYQNNWLLFIDESHMSIPQIEGMYNGDRSRKETLVKFGFRLPAALDNRPLKFAEFLRRIPQTIYTSATPADWELEKTGKPVEQLIRPTGIPDPEISIKKTEGQIDNLILEIDKRVKARERVLVTTLTKRMAEDLALYLQEKGVKVHYLHSEIQTLDRSDILDDLRLGKYDVVVGINLLREGLDLPEVSLVAILDADKEGFLRSETSLIQVMGRAARHINGQVIMYADNLTGSMKRAIAEVSRRRNIQLEYNKKHKITPRSIQKPIREKLVVREERIDPFIFGIRSYQSALSELKHLDSGQLTPEDRLRLVKRLTKEMKEAARDLNFELAAKIRDKIKEITAS